MAKDPAFLFYPGDWLGGTMRMTRSHKGAYMDLLMAQFNGGPMSLEEVRQILGTDFASMWESTLKVKFKQNSSGKFFNEKLENESVKRKKYTDGRRDNLSSKKKKTASHKGSHVKAHKNHLMENENENRNIDEKENKNEIGLYQKMMSIYFEFVKKQTGIPPKIDGAEGKALKSIIAYMREIQEEEEKILEVWGIILNSHHKWEPFFQRQLKLIQINSNFINIINNLKNGKQFTGKNQDDRSELKEYIRDYRSRNPGASSVFTDEKH